MGARWLLLLIPVVAIISVVYISSQKCDNQSDAYWNVAGGGDPPLDEATQGASTGNEESENFPPAQPVPLAEETSAKPEGGAPPVSSLVPDITEEQQRVNMHYQYMTAHPSAVPYNNTFSDIVQGAHSTGPQAQYAQLLADDALEQFKSTAQWDENFILAKPG